MIKINTKAGGIIILSLLCCAAMALFELGLEPVYSVKSAVKLSLFLICPLVWGILTRQSGRLGKLFALSRRGLLVASALGVAVFAVIFGGYFLLGNFFDLTGITRSLTDKAGINAGNFIIVALYISLVNSLLEEFFFRGFAYLILRDNLLAGYMGKISPRAAASLFSASVFALYHVSMMIGWFDAPLFALVMAALFAGGLIFNYINEKYDSVILSWATHMFANLAINAIGLTLFNR